MILCSLVLNLRQTNSQSKCLKSFFFNFKSKATLLKSVTNFQQRLFGKLFEQIYREPSAVLFSEFFKFFSYS